MAITTPNITMGPLKREGSALVVVKHGRLPFGTVVAFRARGGPVLHKLLAMNVLVAIFALGWG